MRTSLILLYAIISISAQGQMATYDYAQEISQHVQDWNKIILPTEIYQHVTNDLNDIRIYGITAQNDTLEAPYIIHKNAEKTIKNEIQFNALNRSNNSLGFYYTYHIPDRETINQIKLDIKNPNYDLRLRLEGSTDQQEWFTVLDDYRILSIYNADTKYNFSTLYFSPTNYAYYRVHLLIDEDPIIQQASISYIETQPGQLADYTILDMNVSDEKEAKQTTIFVQLEYPAPIDQVKIEIDTEVDYIRPVRITYLRDSVQTNKGWIENYRSMTRGQVSSLEDNIFKTPSIISDKLKIIIDNQDNQPIKINAVSVAGFINHLTTRLGEPAKHYLVYGRNHSSPPRYDIARFVDKMEAELPHLELGPQIRLQPDSTKQSTGFFERKVWLYVLMGFIILVLGWQTIKMMRSVESST